MLKSKFLDDNEIPDVPEKGSPKMSFDGTPVRRQKNMIYWYSWGKHIFDIRVVREILGLPRAHPGDLYFLAAKPDPETSFRAIMHQLKGALGNRKFSGVIAEHDKKILQNPFPF
jgi:hypothetical protein